MFRRNSNAYGLKWSLLKRPSFWVIVKSEVETSSAFNGWEVKINVSSRSINKVFFPSSHYLLSKLIFWIISSWGLTVSMGNWYFSEWLIKFWIKCNLLPHFLSTFPDFFLFTSSIRSSMKYLLVFSVWFKFEFLKSYYNIWPYYIILVYSEWNKIYFPL